MVMYDYGNSDMGLLLLANTGSSFSSPVTWYRSGPGGVNACAAWPVVGDFKGDGKPDVLMMYDSATAGPSSCYSPVQEWLLELQSNLGFRNRELELELERSPDR